MLKTRIVDKLADYEHDRWSKWQKYLFSKCIFNKDGNLIIPKEYVDRWTRQMNTNYDNLSNEEKNSDIKEANRIIECIKDEVKFNE